MAIDRHPDSELLRMHLVEELVADQADEIEEHLGQCEACRRQLDQMAAADDWWEQLPESLSTATGNAQSNAGASKTTASPDDLWYVEHRQIQSLLSPTDDPNKIGRLGFYEVVGIVGAGATAVVLKAFDGPLNRYVAIKLLRPTLAASPIARQRFAREARSAASIVHENVIEIHGVNEVDELPYLVMPYVRGESLAKRIEKSWPMSTEAMLHIACQVADGLAAAHDKGLIHRDIKPSNILLGDGIERLKLTDFGLARAVDDVGLTRSGTLAGTPEYMSPEQALGNRVDHRSDLFSLGSVLYAMCTGRPPFTSDSCYGVLRRIVEEQPRSISEFNSEVPVWLHTLVGRLMEKDRDRRLGDAKTLATKLRQCLNHLHAPQQKLPADLQPVRQPSINLINWLAFAAILTCAAIGYGVWKTTPTSTPSREHTLDQRQSNSNDNPSGVVPVDASTALEPSPPDSNENWDDGVSVILDHVSRQISELEIQVQDDSPAGGK